jgi:polyhydroxyalkanoate synthesis regulator protein
MAQAFGVGSFGPLEDQVRRNMEMFEKAFSMFTPFARGGAPGAKEPASPETGPKSAADFDEMKRQLEEMQKRLDRMAEKDK